MSQLETQQVLARVLRDHRVAPERVGSMYGVCVCNEALHDPIWVHQAGKAAPAFASILRDLAEDWGDGIEGFPYQWLLERADEIGDPQEAPRG